MQLYGFTDLYDSATRNPIADWLYEDDWSKQKLAQYEALSLIKPIGAYFDWLLSVRSDEEYLSRYGMEYSDIHDPRKLSQVSSADRLLGSTINFISSNIDRLYR